MTIEEAIESFRRSNKLAEVRLEVDKMRMDTEEVKELEFYIKRDEMAIQALEKESIYDDKEHYVTISKALYDKLNIDYEALSQQPCDDVISREMALKECHDIVIDGERYRVIQEETLLGLPPITQKSGKWIKKDFWKPLPFDTDPLDWKNYDETTHSEKISLWHCSECDAVKGEIEPTARFCENCGAEMGGAE